ncbi:MAG: YnbE family lipoprotein [Nitrospira sp.]|nr:YnbE family lipoprotein [Nitrospira sp.]
MITTRSSLPTAPCWVVTLWCAAVLLTPLACRPRVEVVAPEKPITINLHVKIDHEVRVKVEKELDKVLSEENGLF